MCICVWTWSSDFGDQRWLISLELLEVQACENQTQVLCESILAGSTLQALLPVLLRRKPKQREGEASCRHHTVRQWQNLDSNIGDLNQKATNMTVNWNIFDRYIQWICLIQMRCFFLRLLHSIIHAWLGDVRNAVWGKTSSAKAMQIPCLCVVVE